MAARWSVVVADDHPIVRSGMRHLLATTTTFEVVGEAETGASAVERCAELLPDVMLLDLFLPDASAASVCGRVVEASPDTAIVILTAHADDRALERCMRAGASACLLKDATEGSLIAALTHAVRGNCVLDPRVAGAMLPARRRRRARGDLTERERDVLDLLSRGLSTRQIGDELRVSSNTIKTHTRGLFTKLGARNRVQALGVARERGLI